MTAAKSFGTGHISQLSTRPEEERERYAEAKKPEGQKTFKRREPTAQESNLQSLKELTYAKKLAADRLKLLQERDAEVIRLVEFLKTNGTSEETISKIRSGEEPDAK